MSVVTPADIRAIPEIYAIGKRPLSLLLGWGELTYTRLLDGNTPTPAHAAELRRLLDDPAAFARVLETNRDRITDTAYWRSFRAVDRMLYDQGGALRATRIFAVADRLCALAAGDLTPGALQRLVYYAQGMGFAQLGQPLFDDLPRAAASGPVYDRIYENYPFDEIQRAGSGHAAVEVALGRPNAPADGAEAAADFDEPLNGLVVGDFEIEIVDYGSLARAGKKGKGKAEKAGKAKGKEKAAKGATSASTAQGQAGSWQTPPSRATAPVAIITAASPKSAGPDHDLSVQEIEVVDAAYARYGALSGQALAQQSRTEAPWRKARKRAGVLEGADCDERLTAKSMTKFFLK